ncbi:Vng6411h (plasmid) [Halobacterium salinarum NRC-1]|uniref:Spurious ORF n=1 Tax=Halobacterium salinarum (strain ATCC 700922 / JCM 11081 / NRC-1) TaxID=64091 RepID=Q9HHG4_HALSA|nr:Vng6411h [Halobacterium salinarum NRC-1]DAC79985.1 TPA_inf: spurious ORF [Halobacterium salinarum NRC-1]
MRIHVIVTGILGSLANEFTDVFDGRVGGILGSLPYVVERLINSHESGLSSKVASVEAFDVFGSRRRWRRTSASTSSSIVIRSMPFASLTISSMSDARLAACSSPSVLSMAWIRIERFSCQPQFQQFCEQAIWSSSSAAITASTSDIESGRSGPTSIVMSDPHSGHCMVFQNTARAVKIWFSERKSET